jgi:Methyltransferase domain
MATSPDHVHEFTELTRQALSSGSFRRLVLAKPRSAEQCPRITVREVLIRNEVMLSFVSSFPTNDITKNLSVADGMTLIGTHLAESYLRAHLTTASGQVDLLANKKGTVSIHHQRVAASDAPVERSHDRVKKRFVAQDRPYLTEVGITDRSGQLVPSMARKWKQINKFVEVLDTAIRSSVVAGQAVISVVDFGSGKGYLTFALHDHLTNALSWLNRAIWRRDGCQPKDFNSCAAISRRRCKTIRSMWSLRCMPAIPLPTWQSIKL